MLSGYLAYTLMWVWIGRTLFLYHYMPAVYLGFLALAALLAECWYGGEELWFEHRRHPGDDRSRAPSRPRRRMGRGGTGASSLEHGAYRSFDGRENSGKFVTGTFVVGVVVLFIYFFPVWTAMPIERSGYYARMWLQGSGIRNWI